MKPPNVFLCHAILFQKAVCIYIYRIIYKDSWKENRIFKNSTILSLRLDYDEYFTQPNFGTTFRFTTESQRACVTD